MQSCLPCQRLARTMPNLPLGGLPPKKLPIGRPLWPARPSSCPSAAANEPDAKPVQPEAGHLPDTLVTPEVVQPSPSTSSSTEDVPGTSGPPVVGPTAAQADAGSRGDGAASHPVDVPDEVLEEEEDLIASKELAAELMDGSTFGKRGEQWLLAQVAAVAMLLFPPLVLKGLVDFLATVSLTAGLVFMVSALFSLGRSISPLPQPRKKHQLVVSGIYGYARHPMYGGLLLAALGLAVLTRNETRLAITAVLWWVLENMVSVEESALSGRYAEYTEYRSKVKKFLPFLY
ncbi:putative protein-S-isoprenylcysteine O-methyltransferase [Tetrabaena socialis]|uniref:Protein-S-isoprenylcysteine O-methyltransferase n=1 Tax=Tetrabaena socialis TaxID=47790 RepID=A0A2J8AH66_9CHLO|nr:putative protein-S-isoprenylcysteine O-methyltransferase [Tetrabaena socialis]|eukprot:PNH11878.1 putative protein-S-isoprenylcysteine O-methyltransferase [Tetrabaena socialis]